MNEKILTTPPEPRRLILTREAAKVIGCSMSNVRWLGKTGRIKFWSLGPRSVAYDYDECVAYKKAQEQAREIARREGRRGMGKLPQGFSADRPGPMPKKRRKKA